MPIRAKYVHTKLIARDWKKLVRFYGEVFGCIAKGPERDLSGAWLDQLTSLRNAHLRGVHLRLPGYGEDVRRSRFSATRKWSRSKCQRQTSAGSLILRSRWTTWTRRCRRSSRAAAALLERL